MKILLVNKFYDPTIGGVESVVKQHAEFFAESGHDVTVLCCHDKRDFRTSIEVRRKVKVVRCASLGTFFSMPVAPFFLFRLFLLGFKSCLVFFHLPFPLATFSGILFPFRRKFYVFWHSDIVQQKRLKNIVQALQKILCWRAERVFVTSPDMVKYSQVVSQFSQKVSVLPLSLPSFDPDRDELRMPVEMTDVNGPYALFIGRLCYYKGVDVLLDAIREIAKNDRGGFWFVIVGDGPLRQEVKEKLGSEVTDKVLFIDRHVSEYEKEWLLKNSEILLFPSTEPSEAFGIIQLEAMRHGVPVINTSLKTGVPWVSQHELTGLTVPPRDSAMLAGAIKRMISNDEERERFGRNAAKRQRSVFSDDRVFPVLKDEIGA